MDDDKKSFVKGNNIYILGEFNSNISTNVIPDFVNLISSESSKKNPTITIYINSIGGDVKELESLLAMVALAKAQGIKIVTIVLGYAFSCGSMLAVVGDERYIYEYGKHLLHSGTTGCIVSTIEQSSRQTKRINEFFNTIREHYRRFTKLTDSKIEKIFTDDDYYMNASECIENGLADFIIKNHYKEQIKDKKNKKRKVKKHIDKQ